MADRAEQNAWVSRVLGQLPARINWDPPADVVWAPGGFALGDTQLNATTEPGGLRLAFDPPAGQRLGVGTHTLTASLAPGQIYSAQPKQVQLKVGKIPARIVWNPPANVIWVPGGFTPGATQLDAVTDPPGGQIVYVHETDGPLAPGPHRITGRIAEDDNYEAAPVTHTLTVDKAPARIIWDTPASVPWTPPGGFIVGDSQLNATTDPPGLKIVYSGHDGGGKEVGDHQLTAKLDDPNYVAADTSVTLTVTKADPRLSWPRTSGHTKVKAGTRLTVNAPITNQVANPDNVALTFTPSAGAPLALGANTITVTASDTAHYIQTPRTFTLTIREEATIGLIKDIEVPADAEGKWIVDVSALEVRTKPPGLAVVYDPPNGTEIYAGNAGITVSLDPSVTNYVAEQGWAKVTLVFPPKPEARPDDNEAVGTGEVHVTKGMLNKEYPYGAGNTTPHIHKYGDSFHIKLAGGQRLNLVQKGALYQDNLETTRQAVRGNATLLAIINALVKPYEG